LPRRIDRLSFVVELDIDARDRHRRHGHSFRAATCLLPAVGIAESAMLEAADAGRRFGVATTTPDLADQINARARDLGLGGQYTGIRLTDGDPNAVVADPERLRAALA